MTPSLDQGPTAPPELPEDERDIPVRGWVTIVVGGVIGLRSVYDWVSLDALRTESVLLFMMATGLVALGAWGVAQRRREQRFVAIATPLDPASILQRVAALARTQGWRPVGRPNEDAMVFDAPPEDWSDSQRRVRIVVRKDGVYVSSMAPSQIDPVANARNIDLVRAALDGEFVDRQ